VVWPGDEEQASQADTHAITTETLRSTPRLIKLHSDSEVGQANDSDLYFKRAYDSNISDGKVPDVVISDDEECKIPP